MHALRRGCIYSPFFWLFSNVFKCFKIVNVYPVMRVVVHYVAPPSYHLEALGNFHFNASQQQNKQFNNNFIQQRFSLLLVLFFTNCFFVCFIVMIIIIIKYNSSTTLTTKLLFRLQHRTPPTRKSFPPLNYSLPELPWTRLKYGWNVPEALKTYASSIACTAPRTWMTSCTAIQGFQRNQNLEEYTVCAACGSRATAYNAYKAWRSAGAQHCIHENCIEKIEKLETLVLRIVELEQKL